LKYQIAENKNDENGRGPLSVKGNTPS